MAIREKIKRRVHRVTELFERSPTPERLSTRPTNDSEPSKNPVPISAPGVSSSSLNHPPVSGALSAETQSTLSPYSTETTRIVPRSEVPHAPTQPVDDAIIEQDQALVPALTSATERSATQKAWSGLETFIGLLNESADAFGPLKSGVGGISRCVEIFERAAKGREDYKTLKNELDSLFQDLSRYMGGSTPPGMTLSIENLAKGIEREIEIVRQKGERSRLERYAEAMDDADEVLECYRRIQFLLTGLALNSNVNAWKTVDEQATDNRLDRLSYSLASWYSSSESSNLRRDGCTPNTRIQVLKELADWASDPSGEKIYWLNGMAGTGKTTIAYSLCDQLDGARKLAANFLCSRQLPECRNVNRIFPTIAHQLAGFSRPFRCVLSRVLEQNPQIHARKLAEQFSKLIVEPLKTIEHTMPADPVVVIDALDECDDDEGEGRFLDALFSQVFGLPIKFFVTSRPEPKIRDRMLKRQGERARFELHLHDLESLIVKEDIRTYLSVKLVPIDISESQIANLAEQAGVLFIYASTVVRHDVCIVVVENRHKEIDVLYSAILAAAFDDPELEDSDRQDMELVLHTIVCSQEPLTVTVLASLLKPDDSASVRSALRSFLSVLHLAESSELVTTLRALFPDYLFDKSRSNRFYCNTREHHAHLVLLCFDVIKTPDPAFNIGNLESSHLLDHDMPDLGERIDNVISKELFYACRYWGLIWCSV